MTTGSGGLWRHTGLAALPLAGVACLLATWSPLAPLRALAAVLLVAGLPGWALFSAFDTRWAQRQAAVRVGLSVVGSVAVASLLLYWGCLGHRLGAARVTLLLMGWCGLVWGLGCWLRRRHDVMPANADGMHAQLLVCGAAALFALSIAAPWSTSGRHLGSGVSQSPCSGDWSKHRSLTYAILDTGVPPRNPYVHDKALTYYYGLYLQAAAVVRLSGGALGVDEALRALSVLLALATVPVLYLLGQASGASPTAAALGSALVSLVGGLDLIVLLLLRAFPELGYWEAGHSGVWASAPRVPFPYSNLHWAPQHHAAALMSLVAMWQVSEHGRDGLGRVAPGALLVGGAWASSVYVGATLSLGWAAAALLAAVRGVGWRDRTALRGASALACSLALGCALASGIVLAASHMVKNERTKLALALPRLDYADWMLRVAAEGAPLPVGSVRDPGFVGRAPSAASSWMSERGWGTAIRAVAGVGGVAAQLGLVGLLGLCGLRAAWRARGLGLWLLVLAGAWLVALFVENYDLRMRSAGLGWMLLSVPGALALDGAWRLGWGARSRRSMVAAAVLLGLPGLGCLGWEVAGVSRPVYFDASDVAVMEWVRAHAPERAVVQAYPGTEPRVVAMPAVRYFVWPGFPELTGRCAALGDRAHVAMFCEPGELMTRLRELHAAFDAADAARTAQRLSALGVDMVLWTSSEAQRGAAGLRRRLRDPRYFEVLFSSGSSFVARVLPGAPVPGNQPRG